MASIRKSLALSFAGRYSELAVGTVSILILARLLTPAEIGIYSVGVALAALAHVVRDFGIGNYLVQEKELTTDRVRTALGIALAIAWTMAAMLFALSGPLARFYDEPGLQDVLVVLSISFLITPVSSPALALLRRDMAFGRLYVVNVTSALVQATVAVSLAATGHGFMSPAWASLAGVSTTALTAAIFRPQIAWAMPSFKEWRRVMRFGGVVSATGVITQLGVKAVDLILGRILGFTAVGLYSRAQGLIGLFHRDVMGAVHAVAFPGFASAYREKRRLREPLVRGISIVTVFAWPFYGFLALMAFPVVRILFGSQWDASIPLVRILCIAGAVGAFWSLSSHVLMATGHIDRILRAEMVIQTSRIVLVIFTASIGLEAVAGAQVLVYIIGMIVYFRELFNRNQLTFRDVVLACRPSVGVTLCSLIVPVMVVVLSEVGEHNIWLPFALGLAGAATGWLGGVMIIDHPVKSEIVTVGQKLIGLRVG